MEYTTLNTKQENAVLYIEIDRKAYLNALNKAVIADLTDCLEVAFSESKIKGMVIMGAGEKAFVAGADIKEFVGLNQQEATKLAQTGHQVFNMIAQSPKPIIAAINGYALGGGLELALACHLRIASENAKFGFPELGLGIIPGYGGTQRLPCIVGKGKALELILTTEVIDAEEALRCGLVNAVVSADNLKRKATEIMMKIITKSPEAIRAAIAVVNACCSSKEGYAMEIEAFGQCFGTANAQEGITAFLEKRRSMFQ